MHAAVERCGSVRAQREPPVVRWLVERCGCDVNRVAVDAAVNGRRLHVLEYLYERSSARCSRTAVDDVARNGYTDIARVIVSGRRRQATSSPSDGCSDDDDTCRSAMSSAARNGQLEIVKLLAESNLATHDAPHAIDQAAKNGHYDAVTYLHEHFQQRNLKKKSPDESDVSGAILDVVCTTAALDGAARNGHLDVVKFLHRRRSEGCTTGAMDGAAANSHLDIVRFLHKHRHEGCTLSALERAVDKRHWNVTTFLCDHRFECDVELSLANAVSSSSFDMVIDHWSSTSTSTCGPGTRRTTR